MEYTKKQKTKDDPKDVLKNKIKSGDLSGTYIFYGPEEYLKRYYFSELCKGSASFNVTEFSGDTFSFSDFFDAVSTVAITESPVSFFEDEKAGGKDNGNQGKVSYRIIKLYNIDFLLSPAEEKKFIEILSEKQENTIIVFYYPFVSEEKDKNMSKGFLKKACAVSLCVNFCHEAPQSPKLFSWIKKHFDKEKISIDKSSILYLIDSVGCDMSSLNFEIEKLCAYAKFKNLSVIYNDDIDYICIKNQRARIFDIANAAISKNFELAIKNLEILKNQKESPLLIFGTVSKAINDFCSVCFYKEQNFTIPQICEKTGMYDFVVRNYYKILSQSRGDKNARTIQKLSDIVTEYDEKLKTFGLDGYILLENMIAKIIAV